MFVRVEHDVCTIRHIIRIHGHALQVVSPVHKNANLSIVRIPQVKVGHDTTKFDDAILGGTTFIAVTNLHPTGINAGRVFPLIPRRTSVSRMIVAYRLDDVQVLVSITLLNVRNGDNRRDSPFLRVVYLRDADTIAVIALGLQNE